MENKVLIVDFGSQYTQLIARRIRELFIFCEIHPYNNLPEKLLDYQAVVFSGSPYSVYQEESPYNLIFIDNPIEKIPNEYINQLNSNMGIIVMVEKINDELSKAYKIIKNKESMNKEYLFDVFTKYELFSSKKDFVF